MTRTLKRSLVAVEVIPTGSLPWAWARTQVSARLALAGLVEALRPVVEAARRLAELTDTAPAAASPSARTAPFWAVQPGKERRR